MEIRLVSRLSTSPGTIVHLNAIESKINLPCSTSGGVFVLSPRQSEIDALAGRVTRALTDRGDTLESMLQALREEREGYGTSG